MITKEPWSLGGQLIVGPPEPFPNPKSTPMGKIIGELYWDWGGDRGATERRIGWKEAEANGRLIIAAPALLRQLEAAERALRWAAQEAHGRVKAEIVGGLLHHADLARAAIDTAKGGAAQAAKHTES